MRQLLAVAFALSFCAPLRAEISLNAQYQWLDRSGQMVFSDQPPPASVPLSRILRVGDPTARPSAPDRSGDTAAASAPSTEKPSGSKPSLNDQMAEFETRRAERKADRRKRANQAKLAKAGAKACERMRANKEKLDSGVRLRTRDKSGETAIMTDAQRMARTKDLAGRLEKCRS